MLISNKGGSKNFNHHVVFVLPKYIFSELFSPKTGLTGQPEFESWVSAAASFFRRHKAIGIKLMAGRT